MRQLCSKLLGLVVLAFAFTGCNGGPVEEKIAVPTSNIQANVKKTLEEFAKTGQTGSALTSLESDINGIKSSDSAKGAALFEGYQKLQQVANQPDKVKEIAKEMLGKL